MNQSIIFPDVQSWNEDARHIVFPAQCQGALIECIVTVAVLEELSGQSITSQEDAIRFFSLYRFDLEELAEQLIDDEAYNALGQIDLVVGK
ncbi:DUF1488 domain-containing protein [Vibrio rhizosphaerae]|uniref:DUF1488 domain-containing protein n=1 Tax=Vibrio rhizosphaerae TaxID=398736 RepID=A0ABU4IRA3_9VIBR|nr:DUF1488 domain-containing protein [Vibrio rhizosphaerae]MDW6091463.1 DUF1488 domain-containing protein [Vibrio rhizosphaerae]